MYECMYFYNNIKCKLIFQLRKHQLFVFINMKFQTDLTQTLHVQVEVLCYKSAG